ncbi:hypothetical protein AGR6A_Lc70027 [Agrobacterium sp. NCPPB 925]|nr:hypothetical protein AGR6A_Lc70027 [Agrobacterium sp. NCPPB 925]
MLRGFSVCRPRRVGSIQAILEHERSSGKGSFANLNLLMKTNQPNWYFKDTLLGVGPFTFTVWKESVIVRRQ